MIFSDHTPDRPLRSIWIESHPLLVTTTSTIEWKFVVEPDCPPDGGWPIETKLPRGVHSRTILRLDELQKLVNDPNAKLKAMGEPEVIVEEVIGARLYTGPMFIKFNGVLRGIDSRVPAQRIKFTDLCRGNKYTTTLQAINSAIVKLSKLTVATKVYRGISGRGLPDEFWQENRFGVRGGIEAAFMSTSTAREVALSYAADSDAGGFIFEMQQGMIDRGGASF